MGKLSSKTPFRTHETGCDETRRSHSAVATFNSPLLCVDPFCTLTASECCKTNYTYCILLSLCMTMCPQTKYNIINETTWLFLY